MYQIRYLNAEGFEHSHMCSSLQIDSVVCNINNIKGMVISITKVC